MKTNIVIFVFSLLCHPVFAQVPTPVATVKGIVTDSIKQQPLGYVTVVLSDKTTGKALKSTLTKENGSFEFTQLPVAKYTLSVVMTGYRTQMITLADFPVSGKPLIDVGSVTLAATAGQMNDVVVSTTVVKPIIKQEVDRINYDVQADPENAATNVLDMLRKVPLVSVDAADNIKLKGSDNYKILINGKPSSLVARNPSDIFKAMPASNIQKIEVITTPPAKYDAEGLAGIINIITKKNQDNGYNGSVNVNYNTVNGPGFNINGTVKQDKFGFNGYMGHNEQLSQATGYGYTNNIINPVVSLLFQQGTRSFKGHNNYGSGELSFEIDSLDLLTGSIEYYGGFYSQDDDQQSSLSDASNTKLQSYHIASGGNNNYEGTDLAFNYQRSFTGNKDRQLTASYKYSYQNNTQNTDARYSDKFNYDLPDYRQYNSSGTREHTVQLDYTHPLKILSIEGGGKLIARNNFSNFSTDNLDPVSGLYVPNLAQTNDFKYRQDVYSAYNSYQLKLPKFIVKAGLRLEHTTVNADFTSTNSSLEQDYNNFVPSISLQRTLKGNNNLNLGFTNRIQRPGIWQLNPFVDKSNPQVINMGNPKLQPVVNHSIELTYSNFKKGSVTVGLSYNFANNTVQNVTSVGTDTVTVSTYQNVGKDKRLGISLNTNYPVTKKLNVSINAQLLHVWLSGTYNGQFYDRKGIQGHIFTNTGYTFNKGYHAGFDIGYDSRYVLLQGKDNDYFYVSFSGSKDILNKKATISLYVNNPFQQFRRLDYYMNTNDFNQYNYNDIYFRRINISFKYKFGKLNSSIKKNDHSISNDDLGGRSGH